MGEVNANPWDDPDMAAKVRAAMAEYQCGEHDARAIVLTGMGWKGSVIPPVEPPAL